MSRKKLEMEEIYYISLFTSLPALSLTIIPSDVFSSITSSDCFTWVLHRRENSRPGIVFLAWSYAVNPVELGVGGKKRNIGETKLKYWKKILIPPKPHSKGLQIRSPRRSTGTKREVLPLPDSNSSLSKMGKESGYLQRFAKTSSLNARSVKPKSAPLYMWESNLFVPLVR